MKNILITGGLGFIGSHLSEALVKSNNVYVIDNLSKRVHPYKSFVYKPRKIKFIESNINNSNLLKELLPKIDIIYHFASHQDHLKDYSKFIENNVKSTSLIFEILNDLKSKRLKQFILASSQSVYGNGYVKLNNKNYEATRILKNLKNKIWYAIDEKEKYIRHKETDIPRPINIYGLSKQFQEDIVKQCARDLDINYTILRYSIVQGARQSFFNSYSGLCRNLITSYIKEESPIIFEDGNSIRDFINIKDVTKANCLILNNIKAYNEIFNIGGGKGHKLLSFNKIVEKELNTKINPIVNRYFRINDPRYTVSNIDKMNKYFKWKPMNDINLSIKQYIDWVYKHKRFLKLSKNSLGTMVKQGSVIDCN